jgi:pSer/pThr/pTyr-binding forkhead associated (FHA) protein
MPAYALKFISGKYQGGEFPLPPEREIVIGRSSELDMVLVEDMVSRKHAKITTNGAQIVIMDLGSTNGTFVNGEKVRKTRLKEGDRILIGTSILKVVVTQHSGISPSQAREALAEVGKEDKRQSSMSGTLEEVPVPDLLQLFSTSKRTGILHIKSKLGYGKIYLRNGNVFYASIDDDHDLGPMKALCRIVGWDSGSFEFGPPEENAEFMLELEDSTESLLMEALRQLDEFRRIARDLPPPAEPLTIPKPLEPSLSSLQANELDVFQLVLNKGLTQKVFDSSSATDYETATALLSLLSQGYIARR